MPTTANYSWPTPADTDLVKDGAEAIRDLGNAVDTTVKAVSDASGLVHIKTTSFSGAVSHSFGSDADPIFTSDYDNYRILIRNAVVLTSDQNINLRLRANTTDFTGANYESQIISGNGTTASAVRTTTTSMRIGTIGKDQHSSVTFDIMSPFLTEQKSVHFSNMYTLTGTGTVSLIGTGIVLNTGSYNGFTIFTGTNLSGTLSVYGYRK